MSTELIINASLPETRIALMENGEIQELLIERPSGKGIVGNIYKGRVTRVLPGMQAAFVDIGLEKAAFLYVDDIFVHSEIWEEEEGATQINPLQELSGSTEISGEAAGDATGNAPVEGVRTGIITPRKAASVIEGEASGNVAEGHGHEAAPGQSESASTLSEDEAAMAESLADEEDVADAEADHESESDELDFEDSHSDEDDDDHGPVKMSTDPKDPNDQPPGTTAPESASGREAGGEAVNEGGDDTGNSGESSEAGAAGPGGETDPTKRKHRRGRRGGRFRRKEPRGAAGEGGEKSAAGGPGTEGGPGKDEAYPENYHEQVSDEGRVESDRSALGVEQGAEAITNRPQIEGASSNAQAPASTDNRQEFKAQRGRDRRIRARTSMRPPRPTASIQDLLKEGQEVLVQVAKDPIATKGARLTCHISLPGRHLVCMPTIDHVGVSRRIERDDERRRLREYVEKYRPKGLGFIVRTASGKNKSEERIKQDVEYLARLWNEIKGKAAEVTAPSLVYEDLNPVLRAIRDWVTEEIDKIVVDSRYYFNDIQRFVSHFMPSLRSKCELYHGDIPIFDAYNISTELSRGLERKVWLKSGGYLVVDQAEALVAIDVNTGRYVGKKNLEDTILKTNLEAVQEIAYQLRLRNCGGIIILDLIDMEKDENKQRVYRALEEALKKDRARPSILKISELGLIEMTRKRTRDTMVRALCEPCGHCEGKGFIKSKLTVAYEVLREVEREGIDRDVQKILVQAHSDVIDILAIDERESLDQLERRYHKQIYLQSVGDMHPEQFEVSSDRKDRPAKEYVPENQRERANRERGRGRNRNSGNSNPRAPGQAPAALTEGSGRERERSSSGSGGGRQQQPRGPKREHAIPLPRDLNSIPAPLGIITNPSSPNLGDGSTPQVMQIAAPRAQAFDEDAIGNRVGGGLPTPLGQAPGGDPSTQGEGAPNAEDEFYDEEDRLAFLRAQATQDAALARLKGSDAVGNSTQRPRHGGGRGAGGGGQAGAGQGDKRGRRGRRGGKFTPRDNRGPRNFTPRPGGPIAPVGAGGSSGENTGGGSPGNSDSGGGGSSGGSSGGGGGDMGDSGGGGDHSQP